MTTALLEKLEAKYNLQFVNNKKNSVKIKPIDKYNWTSYPIEEDDYIILTVEQLMGVIMHEYQFNNGLTDIEDFDAENYRSFLREKGIMKNDSEN